MPRRGLTSSRPPGPAPMPPGFPSAAPPPPPDALTIFGQALDHFYGRLEPGGVHGAGLRHVPVPSRSVPSPPAAAASSGSAAGPRPAGRARLSSARLGLPRRGACSRLHGRRAERRRATGSHPPRRQRGGVPGPCRARPPHQPSPSDRAGHNPPSTSDRPHPTGRARPATPLSQPTAHPYLPPSFKRPCYVSHSGALPLPALRPEAARGTPGNVVRPPRPAPGLGPAPLSPQPVPPLRLVFFPPPSRAAAPPAAPRSDGPELRGGGRLAPVARLRLRPRPRRSPWAGLSAGASQSCSG